jgi:hypothetical protein
MTAFTRTRQAGSVRVGAAVGVSLAEALLAACSSAYFAGDSGPGAVTGRGSDAFGAKWWLVNPAGTAITTAVTVPSGATPAAPASSASGGGGY